MQLRATENERRDIGGALADAISYFDDAAPFVRLLNFLGPWAGVIDGLADAIYDRIVYIAQHRRGRTTSSFTPATSTRPPVDNGRANYVEDNDDDDLITAPDPGRGAYG